MKLTKPQQLIYEMDRFAGGAISVVCGSMIIRGSKDAGELTKAANDIFNLNEALRIRIREIDGEPQQYITEYQQKEIEVLHFETKEELDAYASEYAKTPMDIYGELCQLKAIVLKDSYGMLAKTHHIISDAWTLTLIGSQLNQLLNGEQPEIYAYSDYLADEECYLQSKRYGKDREYFLEQFRKCDEVTYLSDKQSESHTAKRKSFVVESNLTRKITAYAKQRNTSPFVLFMTALAVYLNRVKMNTEKFYIGTAVLNRVNHKEKNTMGMYINTAPVLMELANEETFAANLTSVATSTMSVLRHQKYNYGDTLKELRKEFGFGEKLYDVMLSYQNARIIGCEQLESTWYHCGQQNESLQVHIDDRDSEDIFHIDYDYQTEKFTEKDIERLHDHLFTILNDAMEHEDKKLYELDILTPEERQQLLYEFNDTAVDYPKDKCVHQLFEEQVTKTPDKTAVIACDRTLTYAQLNEQANRIAHGLIEKGVQVGDIVAFALSRKSYLIATMLGILKAGAAYLPIDPDYPQERIDFMLEDSGAKIFVTDDNIQKYMCNSETSNPEIKVSSANLCYCIYTSGSTGKPKGTLLKHQGIVNLATNLNIYNNLSNCKRFGFMTTITFDVATQEIFTAFLNGFIGVLMPERKETKSDTIIEGIINNKIDIMYATPTYFDALTDTIDRTQKLLSSIKCVCLAGEKFSLNKNVLEYKDNYDVVFENQYGPVELHVIATATTFSGENIESIGMPIGNNEAYIVDKYMKPVPIGVVGELCIAGVGVGVGYLNRPELTAEKFVDNPFGEGKMYKTGDLAYWREDGNIVYIGRNDFQVKIRGLRIELGEIENAISCVDGVTQAVVVVRKNEEGRQIICAFYTGEEVETKELRKEIGQKLPQYMLPHLFTHIESMPLTTSGKVNRKALPEIDLQHIENATEYVPPQTVLEKILAEAVQNVLGLEKVGIQDNFFDIGGDSLKAIQLISQLEKAGYHTDTKTIFASNTIKELAEKLDVLKVSEKVIEQTEDIPATPAQMRIYTAQNMDNNSTTYNVPYAFRVKEVDVQRLERAARQLIERHEILRTHFENVGGKIVQIIDDKVDFSLEQMEDAILDNFIRPFDLSKSPLLRVGYSDNTIMIDMHHIITDGSSMPVFLQELNELYMGRTLPDNPVQYRQFAMETTDYTESEKYWISVYKDELPVLEINTDYKRGNKQSFNGDSYYSVIDMELHNKILAKCKELNITPYVFYMGGFNVFLSKTSGNEDIIVGMPISGRNSQYLHTIGMFVNTIALRNKVVAESTTNEFLQQVKENSINAITYQDYPYGELIKKLNITTRERNPLFDVMFAYQSEEMTEIIFGDEPAEILPVPVRNSKYDFTFNVMPREKDVVLMVEFCTDLFKNTTIQRYVEGYKHLLEEMLGEKKLVKEISIVTKQELHIILNEFNNTKAEYPKDKCVHQLFEEQVARMPNKTALVFADRKFSFMELNSMANGLARQLKEANITENNVVAIISKRSYHIVIAMLAIFKCGATYLPIDYNYPQERIDTIVNDAQCKAVLTYNVEYDDENVIKIAEEIEMIGENFECNSTADDICGIIYTSGSTGTPKGTLLHHRGLVNYTYANNALYSGGNCVIGFSIYTFDAFFLDTISPMLRGVTAVMATESQQFNQIEFENLIKQNPNCNMFITPAKFKQFVDNCCDIHFYKKIHSICIGGEVFPQEFANMFSENTNVFNVYGPTECSMWMLECQVIDNDVTLGTPLYNTRVYIVDKNNNLLPIGVTGELCIAGDCVGAGYLNRPELTAEKFVDNPFGEGKMYKTGDLAYWREDGNIVYVGRNDFQVKIRGLRIELGEIESVLSGIEGITQSVVIVRKNEEGRQFICAFYTGKEVDAKELRQAVGQKLPKYMVPHIFTHIDNMPLTTSGKVNRKALPEVALENITSDVEYLPPKTRQQKVLCQLMEEVLGVAPIGLYEDFFDMGGDSLKAIEFVSKAHNEGLYFSMQNVFDYPAVELLTNYMEQGDKKTISYEDVDFTRINEILVKNRLQGNFKPQPVKVGNLLLAGATGYLGMHILADFLDNDTGTAFCLVRGKDTADSVQRFKELLMYYFGNKYIGLLYSRIEVYCADLQKENFGLPQEDYTHLVSMANTVVNAAASVKHYGSYKYFQEANVDTVEKLIKFCKKANAKLIHTSTLSVSGNSFGDDFDGYISEEEKHFGESSLYIGQPLENVYARSKFEAEKLILEAMAKGLKANIMRMGNLTNRMDGKFQKNYETNAFLQRVKAILELGIFPEYLMYLYTEFTPIDDAASAVMTITRHFSMEQTVFHINSIKVVYFDKLMEYFQRLGFGIQTVDGKTFTEALRQTTKNTGMEYIFETFINDMDENDQLNYDSNIRIDNDFTVEYLRSLGFEWSEIDFEYIKKYVEYFKGIGYFKQKEQQEE